MARAIITHSRFAVALAALLALAIQSAQAKTELLVFTSKACPPCRMLKPTLAEMQSEGYPVRVVDVAQHPALVSQFRVMRVPCLVMVTNGRELARQMGGDRNSIATMFRTAGVNPEQIAKPQSPAWANPPAVAPALPAGPEQSPQVQLANTSPAPDQRLRQRLLEASVRITVIDSTGKSYGTGTIIDTLEEDALIVTCGHLFRGESAKGEIIIEQYAVTAEGLVVSGRSRGELMHSDLDRDVALVSFRPTASARVAPVASQFVEQVNDRVWSVGCDRGADPTVRDSRVTAIDRYNGAPNVETSGAPVQGRSGGGLFNSRGELVGVCFAADNEGDEGLYSGLASVHAGLDLLGLQSIYRGAAPDRRIAANPTAAKPTATQAPNRLIPLPDMRATVRGQDVGAPQGRTDSAFPEPLASVSTPPAAPTDLPAAERAALQEIAQRAVDSEVVVVVRPRDASGDSEVLHFDRVSPQFLNALRSMSQ